MSTTASDIAPWSIGDIEPSIAALRANVGILGHLINEKDSVELGEFHHIEDRLIDAVEEIDRLWRRAFAANAAQGDAHKAELAAIRQSLRHSCRSELTRQGISLP